MSRFLFLFLFFFYPFSLFSSYCKGDEKHSTNTEESCWIPNSDWPQCKTDVVLCRKKHFDLSHYSSCGMEHFRILSLSFLTSLLFSLISRMTDTGVSFISQNFRTNQNLQSLMKHYKWFILEILH